MLIMGFLMQHNQIFTFISTKQNQILLVGPLLVQLISSSVFHEASCTEFTLITFICRSWVDGDFTIRSLYKGNRSHGSHHQHSADRLQTVNHCLQTRTKMASYITDIRVSLDATDENQLRAQGFRKTAVDLNKGAGGNRIYLWYKTGSCDPITRIQFSFTDDMGKGLNATGFEKIEKNLNTGAGGNSIYLWFSKATSEYDVPIVKLEVSTEDEAHKFRSGWERSACDLNRNAGGNMIYLWVKREKQTYICDVTATDCFDGDEDYFRDGYIRVDEDTNRGAGGSYVYIWYRQTTDAQRALSSLKISTNEDEYQSCQNQGYESVVADLNKGTGGNQVLLWFKRGSGCGNQIKAITVINSKAFIKPYESAGVQVIEESLNTGTLPGRDLYLCYYA